MTFSFSLANLVSTLPIMLMGMMGVFIVTAVIIITVMLLNLFNRKG